ncbi:hypothetical protein GCM10025863_28320 [Microbacterium suwonense]|uniref:Uncharacterized protein n=1 Tax=Microbacterium suwonense TaxID=683047 RepID=A0ABM8FWZ7_9MICO|nr:hypothetical protein GCM10025863_28320 [Microbacterium suwonense]
MLTMTEPQVWTLIGVFATGLFGMMTLMSTMFVRIIRAEIQGVHRRLDRLDSDVNALMKHSFGIQRD